MSTGLLLGGSSQQSSRGTGEARDQVIIMAGINKDIKRMTTQQKFRQLGLVEKRSHSYIAQTTSHAPARASSY